MKRFSVASVLAGLLLLAPLLAFGQGVKGNFVAVGTVPGPRSTDTVVAEEFLNFTCPHCNHFREVSKPVFTKYGKRLRLVRMPILFRGQQDPPLRLYFVAQAHGKEDQIADALFDAAFKYGANVYDPAVVNYIARTNGLADAYQKEGGSDVVTKKIADVVTKASAFGVDSTPTLVLQGAIRMTPETKMETFVDDFGSVVGQLLK